MALYNDKMYFGNRNYMQWIPAPQINYESGKRGYASVASFLDGGQFVRRSTTAAKGYNFTWTLKHRDQIRAINDYADGVYGPGAVYFLDPFAMDKNVLPQFWATPALANGDAPMLAGEFDEDRPTVTTTNPNSLGYPALMANYNLTDGIKFNELFIPIPPGYSLWVGAHGTTEGTAGVQVTPTIGATGKAAAVGVPLATVQDIQRMATQVNGDSYNGALLSLKGTGALHLAGVMAQVLPHPRVPEAGGFISGQGHSGCSFVEEPTLTNYSVGIDRVGLSVNLVETEGWN